MYLTIEEDSEESSIFCPCAFITRLTGGEKYFVSVLLYAALRMAEKYFESKDYKKNVFNIPLVIIILHWICFDVKKILDIVMKLEIYWLNERFI